MLYVVPTREVPGFFFKAPINDGGLDNVMLFFFWDFSTVCCFWRLFLN